jgi:MFS family permease
MTFPAPPVANPERENMFYRVILNMHTAQQGMLTHAAVTGTALFPEETRGRAVCFASHGFPIGAGLTPTLGIALITTFAWIETWRIAGSLLLGCVLAMLMMPRTGIMDRKPVVTLAERSESIEAPKMLRRLVLLRDWPFWLLMPTIIGSPRFRRVSCSSSASLRTNVTGVLGCSQSG